MAGPFVIPNTVQVVAYYETTAGGTDIGVNVHHYLNPLGHAVDQAFCDAIHAIYLDCANDLFGGSSMVTALSDNISGYKIGVRDIDSPNLPEFTKLATWLLPTGATDPLPFQTSICTTLRTNFAGKSFRGRTYLFGWAEGSNTSSGNPTPGVQGVATGFMGALKTKMLAGVDLGLAVASRKLGQSTLVTNITTDGRWDTQRRRSNKAL